MADYIIETRDVEYSYPDGTRALAGVTFAVEEGKKVALLGANGAGKSTLFLHLNGILRPQKGKVFFDGREVFYDHRSLIHLRRNVGIVFQDPDNQIFSSNVLQEISFGPLNLGLSKKDVLQRVEEAMQATGISDLKDRPVHFLSYGQKKRVSIAGVLAMRPRVMVLDEPTAGLDPKLAVQMVELFNRINRDGVTVILSTHDVDLAFSWADHVYILKKGSIECTGKPEQVFRDVNSLQENDLVTPWLLDVYLKLKERGWLKDHLPVPRTREELFNLIKPADRNQDRGTNLKVVKTLPKAASRE